MAIYDDEWLESAYRQARDANPPADVPDAEAVERAARNIAEQLYREPGSDKPEKN